MKVAFFVSTFPKLSETFILNQITGLVDLGVDVEIIALKPANESKVHQSYYDYDLANKTIYLYQPESKSTPVRLAQRLITLAKLALKGQFSNIRYITNSRLHPYFSRSLFLCRFFRLNSQLPSYNMIISHFGPMGSLAIKLRKLGILRGPITTVFHGYDMSRIEIVNRYKSAYQEIFNECEILLPISTLWQNRLIEWGCDASKIKIHHMGVDLNTMPSREATAPIGVPLRVICVGRMTEKKGIRHAIEGAVEARKTINLELDIIGDGEQLDEMKSLIIQYNAGDYIRCHGSQTQDSVKHFLSESDVFLLPSVTANSGDMEGIPVALMESMASGLITLTTRHSGIPELVIDGENGYLTDERDAQQIADKLIEISMLTSDEIKAIRVSAYNKVDQDFDNTKLNKTLRDIIQ